MRYAEVKEQPRQVREPWEIPDGAVMLLAGQTGMRSGSGPSLWADDSDAGQCGQFLSRLIFRRQNPYPIKIPKNIICQPKLVVVVR